jgi:hypothetical protein
MPGAYEAAHTRPKPGESRLAGPVRHCRVGHTNAHVTGAKQGVDPQTEGRSGQLHDTVAK